MNSALVSLGYRKEPESPAEDAAEPTERRWPFAPEEQAQRGHKAKTHRGRRSKGKGPKPVDHHAQAKTHLANAQQAPTPKAAHGHLFKALSSLKKAM